LINRMDDLTAEKLYYSLENDILHLKSLLAKNDSTLIHRILTHYMKDDDDLLVEVICNRTKNQLALLSKECSAQYHKTLEEVLRKDVGGSFGKIMNYSLMDRDEFGAFILSKALNREVFDPDAIIDLANSRTNAELNSIKLKWESQNNCNLVDVLTKKGGKYNRKMCKIVINQILGKKSESTEASLLKALNLSKKLYKASKLKTGIDEETFVKILSVESRKQIDLIQGEFYKEYNMCLKDLIKKKTSGNLENALLALLHPTSLEYVAMALGQSMIGFGADVERVLRLLGGVEKEDMPEVCECYVDVYGVSLKKKILRENLFVGEFKKALLALLNANDPTNGLEREPSPASMCEKAKLAFREREAIRNYFAKRDAMIFKRLFEGVPFDENELVEIVCHRSKTHLEKVEKCYSELYNRMLVCDVKEHTEGKFKDFITKVVRPRCHLDAMSLNEILNSTVINESLIVKSLATWSNERIRKLIKKYDYVYQVPLLERLNKDLSGKYKWLILELVKATRNEGDEIDLVEAKASAEIFFMAGPDCWISNEDYFIEIFTKSSRKQIEAINSEYEKMYHKTIQDSIDGEIYGDNKEVLLALTCDPMKFYARQLRKALKIFHVDEDEVLSQIANLDKSESEIVAKHYFSRNGKSIEGKISGLFDDKIRKAVNTWMAKNDELEMHSFEHRIGSDGF